MECPESKHHRIQPNNNAIKKRTNEKSTETKIKRKAPQGRWPKCQIEQYKATMHSQKAVRTTKTIQRTIWDQHFGNSISEYQIIFESEVISFSVK